MKQTRNSKGQFRQIPKISSVYFTTLSRIVISVKRHAYCDFKESTSSVVILGKQTRNYKLTRSIRKKWTSFAIYQTEVELSKWILYFKAPCKRKESCWILHVASVCTLCCMFLRVVGSCCANFETGQTFSYVQTDASTPNNLDSFWPTMLRPFAPSLSYGQCVTV